MPRRVKSKLYMRLMDSTYRIFGEELTPKDIAVKYCIDKDTFVRIYRRSKSPEQALYDSIVAIADEDNKQDAIRIYFREKTRHDDAVVRTRQIKRKALSELRAKQEAERRKLEAEKMPEKNTVFVRVTSHSGFYTTKEGAYQWMTGKRFMF